MIMKSRHVVIFAATLMLVTRGIDAQTHMDTTVIDQAVISKLSAQFGINSKVITHLDLTQTFQTKSRWSLVVAKQPDEESSVEDGGGNRIGAVSLCFVETSQTVQKRCSWQSIEKRKSASFPGSTHSTNSLQATLCFLGRGERFRC